MKKLKENIQPQNSESIAKMSLNRTKKFFAKKFSILAYIVLFSVISLALAIFFPFTLLLTIPLVVMPSLFALQGINSIIDKEIKSDELSFFYLYRLYFTQHFHGGYRLLVGLLKAIATFMVMSTLLSIIGSFILEIAHPEIVIELQELLLKTSEEALNEEMMKFLETHDALNTLANLTVTISLGCSSYVFIHHALYNSIKYYFNLLGSTPLLATDVNVISKETLRTIKKDFNKDYRRSVWLLSLLFVVGYTVGMLIGLYLIKVDAITSFVIGLFGSLIFTMLFIPYFYDVTLYIFLKYRGEYMKTFIRLSMETLEEVKKNKEISSEQEKEIKEFLDAQEKLLNENKEDEDKKEEKNHD